MCIEENLALFLGPDPIILEDLWFFLFWCTYFFMFYKMCFIYNNLKRFSWRSRNGIVERLLWGKFLWSKFSKHEGKSNGNHFLLTLDPSNISYWWTHCSIALREKYPYSEFFCSIYFRIRTEYEVSKYKVSVHIQSECGKIRTRKTPNTDPIYALYSCLDKDVFINVWTANLKGFKIININFVVNICSIWRIRVH